MKNVVRILLLLSSTLFSTEIQHLNIGKQDFMLTVEEYDVYDSKGQVLRIYKEKHNNDLIFMFSLILQDRTGGCSAQSKEDGYYEINGTTVTLYSFWDRKGKAYDAPYGARIQVYTLNKNYDLERTSSRLYIETERQNYNTTSGMQYLFSVPKNVPEKEHFERYIASVEQKYKGHFVYGDEAKKLMDEVQRALSKKAKNRWLSNK